MPDLEPPRNPAVPSPFVAALFEPNTVAAAELRSAGVAALLYPSEAAFATAFAPKRVAEFAAGRSCARRALEDLGITDSPIGINSDRSPRWPPNVVGSITHTAAFCGAVVAAADRLASIGIDAETVGRVTADIYALVLTSEENALVDSLDDDARGRATTIIFSAKEAFYKCQYGLTRAWRDFRDVSLELRTADMRNGDFIVRPSGTTAINDWGLKLPLTGRFQVAAGIVVTGIATRADAGNRNEHDDISLNAPPRD